MGGNGLRSALAHSPAAYLASLSLTAPLVNSIIGAEVKRLDQTEALRLLNASVSQPVTPEELETASQYGLSLRTDQQRHAVLLAAPSLQSVRSKARLNSVGLKHAGDWLNTIPSYSLGLHMPSPDFRTMVKYRLGIPFLTSPGICPACSKEADIHGDHSISCAYGGERISRHHRLRDHLDQTASSGGLSAVKEQRGIIPGNDGRPADVYIRHW
jgi:hypothetical protein